MDVPEELAAEADTYALALASGERSLEAQMALYEGVRRFHGIPGTIALPAGVLAGLIAAIAYFTYADPNPTFKRSPKSG